MEQTTPKPFVFVLMPFEEKFNDIYQLGIKAACNDAGGYCEGVDEQIFVESILDRVYNQIDKADLLIADMTDRNPNVFYEVGYAHALEKRVLLLTQKADDIPFDLKHYPHIVYEGKIIELKQELEKRVRWAFEHPKEFKKNYNEQIEVYQEGIRIQNNPQLTICSKNTDLFLDLVFDFHNSMGKSIEIAQFQVGLIINKNTVFHGANDAKGRNQEKYSARSIILPKDIKIIIVDNVFQILPGSWEKMGFVISTHSHYLQTMNSLNITIRLFTEAGPVDYPFNIGIKA